MVPFWPDVARDRSGRPEDIAFADAMVPIDKIVISRTLKSAADNTTIVSQDPEGLIRQLKQRPGKKIALSSTSLLPGLLALGLIDELYLIVHPILVGDSKRLFNDFFVPENINFQLAYTRQFNSGVIALHYQKNE